MNLAGKLKELRKIKNVSQEKFAEYLGVSYQAVSKWEINITYPDILLLPDKSTRSCTAVGVRLEDTRCPF